jgi:hypothetical protein
MRHAGQGWLLVVFLALGLAACGGGGDDTENISGNYQGDIQDSLAGHGTIVASIAQNGTALSGTFQAIFPAADLIGSGSLSGSITGSAIALIGTPSDPTDCPFRLTAAVDGDDISGTYAVFNCTVALSGTIDITRQ